MPTARRTIIATILIAAAATSFMFATGAAVVSGPADTVASDRLAIQPANGPNGDYAYLNDDNEITIDISAKNPNLPNDFEGINPDTLAATGSVFTITYTGDDSARVWIDHPEENVTFVSDGDSLEGRANNVTLETNKSIAVGFRIDARGEAAGTTVGGDDFSINALEVDSGDGSTDTGSTGSGSDASTSDDDTLAADNTNTESTEQESDESTSDNDTPTVDDANAESTGPESDASASDDDTPTVDDADAGIDGDTGDTPILEPAGIDLGEISGLVLLLVLIVVIVALGRQIQRR